MQRPPNAEEAEVRAEIESAEREGKAYSMKLDRRADTMLRAMASTRFMDGLVVEYLDDAAFPALAALVASLKTLRKLSITGVNMTRESGVAIIDAITANGNLEDISLSSFQRAPPAQLGNIEDRFHARAPAISSLQMVAALRAQRQVLRLALFYPHAADKVVADMGHETTLHSLTLEGVALNDHDSETLAASLAKYRGLHTLRLCRMSTECFRAALRTLAGKLPRLQHLTIGWFRHDHESLFGWYGRDDASLLENFLRATPTLKTVEIQDCGRTTVSPILRALDGNNVIETLDVSGNELNGDSVALLMEFAARRPSLKELNLSHCRLNDACVAEMVRSTSNSLHKVFLYGNNINNDGLRMLAAWVGKGFYGTDIETLGVYRGNAGQALGAALAYWNAAMKPTFALLAGRPTVPTAPAVLARRFILDKDGDHAIWSRVMRFLAARA